MVRQHEIRILCFHNVEPTSQLSFPIMEWNIYAKPNIFKIYTKIFVFLLLKILVVIMRIKYYVQTYNIQNIL